MIARPTVTPAVTLATILSLALACFATALPAAAGDLALILSNQSYRSEPDLGSRTASDRIAAALSGEGFTVVRLQDLGRAASADRLAAERSRIAQADRLVIVLNGHMVSSGSHAWLLAPEAVSPSDLTVGGEGLPLWPFLAMAADHPGAAIVAVARQNRDPVTDPSLTPGYVPGPMPQGVTMLTGPANDLATLFERGLLVPGRPLAQSLAASPGVEATGFLPASAAFLPPGSRAVAAAPTPSPEALRAQAEAALHLTTDDRRRVQRSLAILGFDPHGIDGVIGPGTRAALSAWQTDRRLAATGYLDRAQLRQLLDEGDKRAAELQAEAQRKQQQQDALDTAYWRQTGQGQNEAGLRAYLKRYPDGLFAQTAQSRLDAIMAARHPQVSAQEARDWQAVQKEDSVQAYQAYLDTYPHGAYRDEALARLDARRAAQADAARTRQLQAEEDQVAGNTVARKLVENRLAALGLNPGPADGVFDARTRRAIRRFQETRGLTVTGYVDQATMVRILFGG